MLETWAERPLTSSSLFFIPRTVPPLFGEVYHAILSSWKRSTLTSLLSGISVCFLFLLLCCTCLLTYVLFLLLRRIDWPGLPVPANAFWHWEQAALLHRLPPKLLADSHIVRCSFSDVGFPFSDRSPAYPCYSSYHTSVLLLALRFAVDKRMEVVRVFRLSKFGLTLFAKCAPYNR